MPQQGLYPALPLPQQRKPQYPAIFYSGSHQSRLLQRVYFGLNPENNPVLGTQESLLNTTNRSSARRLSAAHLPFWGLGAIATPLVGGAFFTLVYLWRRDLVACMVAHIAVDSVGLLVAPALLAH